MSLILLVELLRLCSSLALAHSHSCLALLALAWPCLLLLGLACSCLALLVLAWSCLLTRTLACLLACLLVSLLFFIELGQPRHLLRRTVIRSSFFSRPPRALLPLLLPPATATCSNSCEHTLLDMGLNSWRTGLVGRTAHARIRTFDVPIGGGVLAPSRDAIGGVAPIAHELHIHTALVQSARATEGVDGDGPNVTHASWETDREQLSPGAPNAVPVVFMHGYGSGIGIFSQVLPAMPEAYTAGPVYAIDTLGCGLSSRPAADGHWGDMTVRQAEDFFVVDGIERWRAAMGYSKLRLVSAY
jgi:hypothetical protein